MRFFVVGPQKTGSAWLRSCLIQHPEIYISNRVNEIFFFDRYFDRGLTWYEQYFEGSENAKAVGEVAPTYFAAPGVETRIGTTFPQARIITSLRSPIDRAWSMYRYLQQKGDTRAPFRRAVEEFPAILTDGLYARHLKRYLQAFPRGQILNLIYDGTAKDPDLALKKIFRFLQIDQAFVPDATQERINDGKITRSFFASRLIHRTARALHRQGMHEIVHTAKRIGLKKLVLRQGQWASMDEADLAWCRAYFREDLAVLSDLLDLDLQGLWLSEPQTSTPVPLAGEWPPEGEATLPSSLP